MEFWVILIGCLVAISCSLLGSFLVLRNISMIGDAISHSVLPGIVIGFLISQSLHSPLLLLGAGIMGVVTTFIIQLFNKTIGVQNDAAIGVTFTFLFAVGIILISLYTKNSDLDMDCVLYGEILNTPFDRWITLSGNDLGPVSFWQQLVILILVVSFILLFFKELRITSFDPSYASAIGLKTNIWHYALMALVSFVTVAAFEAVGAILVICFLITPAAAAFLLTNKLVPMLFLAMLIGISSIIGGYYISAIIGDTSSSATMAVVCGILFIFAVIISLVRKKAKQHNSLHEERS